MKSRRCTLVSWLCLTAFALSSPKAEGQPTSPSAFPPSLDAEQRAGIERVILANPDIRTAFPDGRLRVIISQPEPVKSESQAFLTGQRVEPPSSYVTALVLDPARNVARRITVSQQGNRVLSVQPVEPNTVPFGEEDLIAAWGLAQRNAELQRSLTGYAGRFRPLSPASEAVEPFAVEPLPLRSIGPKDLCTRDRCLDLIFRTPDGYLPLRAHVNLTRGTVTVARRQG